MKKKAASRGLFGGTAFPSRGSMRNREARHGLVDF
jgi:hypothetical protein